MDLLNGGPAGGGGKGCGRGFGSFSGGSWVGVELLGSSAIDLSCFTSHNNLGTIDINNLQRIVMKRRREFV